MRLGKGKLIMATFVVYTVYENTNQKIKTDNEVNSYETDEKSSFIS